MTCAVSLAMMDRCEATSRAAGRPATAPMAPETTGTIPMACITLMNRGGVAGDSTVAAEADPRAGATLPPPPSRKRISGTR